MHRIALVAKQQRRVELIQWKERNVLEEEMGKLKEWDVKSFGALDGSEKTIVLLGDK